MRKALIGFLLLTLAVMPAGVASSQDSEAPASAPTAAELLPNGRAPMEGVISGGQPSAEQLSAAKGGGYKSVINLRTASEPGEKQADVEALGMSYVGIPIAGAADLTEANARMFAQALDEAERPTIVHCGSGNRAGALFALKAFYVDGKSPEEALAIGKAAGLTGLESAVKEHLEAASTH